jgi:DegV family protein with EDD domain
MIQIITDTTSGLPKEISEKYHIPVIPQIINFGNKSYYEGVDIDNSQFMKMLIESKELPKTAAPPPELFIQEFNKLVLSGGTIFCMHPSAEISGTVRSAIMAAQEFPTADIRVIDTRTVGSSLATLVELAANWASNGETPKQDLFLGGYFGVSCQRRKNWRCHCVIGKRLKNQTNFNLKRWSSGPIRKRKNQKTGFK